MKRFPFPENGKLADRRKALGLKQEQFCRSIGISERTLRTMEQENIIGVEEYATLQRLEGKIASTISAELAKSEEASYPDLSIDGGIRVKDGKLVFPPQDERLAEAYERRLADIERRREEKNQ